MPPAPGDPRQAGLPIPCFVSIRLTVQVISSRSRHFLIPLVTPSSPCLRRAEYGDPRTRNAAGIASPNESVRRGARMPKYPPTISSSGRLRWQSARSQRVMTASKKSRKSAISTTPAGTKSNTPLRRCHRLPGVSLNRAGPWRSCALGARHRFGATSRAYGGVERAQSARSQTVRRQRSG